MRRFLRDNGPSLVLLGFFLALWAGQAMSGWSVFNDDLRAHGQAVLAFGQYLASAHFLEATTENWESEFLQMSVSVFLTMFLYRRGSPESKPVALPHNETP